MRGALCTSFNFKNLLLIKVFTIRDRRGVSFPLIYISSSWVSIRLHTKNQLSRLPASTFFWWGCDCDCDCCDCDGVKTKSTHSLLTKDLVGV